MACQKEHPYIEPFLLPVHHGKRHLPQPRGPHSVGFVDIMTPGDPETGTFARVLYPTKEQCLREYTRWPAWVEDRYLTGMLDFMQCMLAQWPSWAPQTEYLGIHSMSYLSPLIPHIGFPQMFRLMNGHVHVPIIERAIPDKSQKWPVVVFSHGLGCARSIYSRICYDIASYGFVVIAPEHRDGTAAFSFWLQRDVTAPENIREHHIHHKRIPVNDYEYTQRNLQARFRAKEASRALDLAFSLNAGEERCPDNLLNTHHKHHLKHSRFSGVNFCHKSAFKDLLDLRSPVMTGHSFGGATTVLTLAQDKRFSLGIALDAWLFPVMEEDLAGAVSQPMLFVSTESFRSEENLHKISELKRDSDDDEEVERRFYYIKGSVHQNHLDAPFIIQHSLARKVVGMHSSTCPEVVMDVNNKLMVQFIWKQLGMDSDSEVDADLQRKNDLIKQLFEPAK